VLDFLETEIPEEARQAFRGLFTAVGTPEQLRSETREKKRLENGTAPKTLFDRTLQTTLNRFKVPSNENRLIMRVNEALTQAIKDGR